MEWLGQAIGAGAGLIQGIFDRIQSKRNIQRTLEANKELARYQYSKDLEMWNRQNLYNLPSAQMERFKEAGLNPNLIYGQGNAGNAATMPRYQNVQADYTSQKSLVNLPLVLSMFNDYRMKNANVDLLNEQIRGQKARSDLDSMKAEWMMQKTLSDQKGSRLKYMPNWMQKFDTELESAKQNLRNMTSRYSLQAEMIWLKRIEREWAETLKRTKIGRDLVPYLRFLLPWKK